MLSELLISYIVEILALLCKADGVDERESQVVRAYLHTLLNLEQAEFYFGEFQQHLERDSGTEFVSLKTSGQVVRLAMYLNEELTINQKVRLLIVMYALILADEVISDIERDIVYGTAEMFNIAYNELGLIERFVEINHPDMANNRAFQIFADELYDVTEQGNKPVLWSGLNGVLYVLHLEFANIWVVKYIGKGNYLLDGAPIINDQPLELTKGSSIRGGQMDTLYFAEILRIMHPEHASRKVSFIANNISYQYSGGNAGLHPFDIQERSGRLVGIMGPSGSGKSTLLEILVGLRRPDTGQVRLNGYDIYSRSKSIEGLIGYVPQHDMLIADLTVYQNLFYAAKLSYDKYDNAQCDELVTKVLAEVQLTGIAHQLVGTTQDRYVSGGERKRINIALELLRRPAVFFLDEPTSGLSSRDSLRIIDLLKEQTFQSKLVFVVIHQPSSDIFKLFDHLIILDKGGYPIYYGDPISAIVYFKNCIHQINAEVSVCPACANINPEQLFDIIEGRTLNHIGHFTEDRKILPQTWYAYFKERLDKPVSIQELKSKFRMPYRKPSPFKQFITFVSRDVIGKWSNRQYVVINLLTAPVLALILSVLNRSSHDVSEQLPLDHFVYSYANNDNIPGYLFMSVVVAIFMGLTLSATEILDDKKLLKRERFLHLSRLSYLLSKILVLFGILAFQTLLFQLIGNWILGFPTMNWNMWLVLFSIATCGTLISLNLSSLLRSAITIYILVPVLLIPQLLLGGGVIPFSKLNEVFRSENKVPIVAEFIPSRWAFEALMVDNFVNNDFEKGLYRNQADIANAEIECQMVLPLMKEFYGQLSSANIPQIENTVEISHLRLYTLLRYLDAYGFHLNTKLIPVSAANYDYLGASLSRIETMQKRKLQLAHQAYDLMKHSKTKTAILRDLERKTMLNHNLALDRIVRNVGASPQVVWTGSEVLPCVYPVFVKPKPKHLLDFRAHFFAPEKFFMGFSFPTLTFNLMVLWFFNLLLFFALYTDRIKLILQGFRGRRKEVI